MVEAGCVVAGWIGRAKRISAHPKTPPSATLARRRPSSPHKKQRESCLFPGTSLTCLHAIPPCGPHKVISFMGPIQNWALTLHSKESVECKTAACPQQSRCSTQPGGLMRFQCRAFHRLTNAGKQGIVLVSGIFFASDRHGGIGVLDTIQDGRSLIPGISRALPILDQFCAGWIGFTLVFRQ